MGTATGTINNLNQALKCNSNCSCCQQLQNQIDILNQKLNGSNYVTKQEFNEEKNLIHEAIRRLYSEIQGIKKLLGDFGKYTELNLYNNGINGVNRRIDDLQRDWFNWEQKNPQPSDAVLGGNGSNIANQRLTNLEAKTNDLQRQINNINSLIKRLEQLVLDHTAAITKLNIDFKLLETSFNALKAGLSALVKTIVMSILSSILFNMVLDAVMSILKKTDFSKLLEIERLANDAWNTALRALNLAKKADGNATNANNKADKVLQQLEQIYNDLKNQINDLTRNTLNALLELKRQLRYEIDQLTAFTRNALLELKRQLYEQIGIIREYLNKLVPKIQSIFDSIFDIKNQISRINDLIRNIQTELNKLVAKFPELQGYIDARLFELNQAMSKIKADLDIAINAINLKIGNIINTINQIWSELAKLKLPKIQDIDIPKLIDNLRPYLPGIIATIIPVVVLPIITNIIQKPTMIINNNYVTNNQQNITNNNTTVVQAPEDLSWLRQQLNRIEAVGNTNLSLSFITNAIVKTIDEKCGKLIPGGLSGWMVKFSSWKMLDRVISYMTLATTIHNATQLSSNIAVTLIQSMQNVIDFFGLRDSQNNEYNLQDLIGRTLNNLIEGVIGKQNLENFKTTWAKYNRIYQAGANMVNSLLSMGDTIVNGLNTISGQNAHVANALRAWGAVGENAYKWMNPNVNFGNPLLSKLQSLEETASTVEQISQEPLNVKQAKEDLENSAKELADSLEQKDNSKQSRDIPEAAKIKEQKEASKESSKAPQITESDLEADD